MLSQPNNTQASWWSATPLPRATRNAKLALDPEICIIGADAAGLTTGLLLALEGRQVTMLDTSGPSRFLRVPATGHLLSAAANGFLRIESARGPEAARLALASHQTAIDLIDNIIADRRIDCHFTRVDGYFFAPAGDAGRARLEQELDAARRAGFGSAELLEELTPGLPTAGPCLRFPLQAQLNPLRYLTGIQAAFERLGGQICSSVAVERLEPGPAVVLAGGQVLRPRVLIATAEAPRPPNAPGRFVSGSVCALAARIPRGAVPRGIFRELGQGGYHARLAEARDSLRHEVLIAEGERGAEGQEDNPECAARLEQWVRRHFPMIQSVEHRWTTRFIDSPDGLGHIGPAPELGPDACLAVGDSGMSLTHGTVAAMILADFIAGRPNDWAALYDPSR